MQFINLMINLRISLLFLGIVSLAISSGLWLDTEDTEFFRKTKEWNTFKIHAAGGSGIYSYRYYDLPPGWDYKNDDLYIPADFKSGRHQIKVQVFDVFWGVKLETYVVIELTQGDLANYKVYLRDKFDQNYNLRQNYPHEDRVAYEYPSWDSISTLIEQGDTTQIEGIIMKTIDSSNQCDDKKQFLAALLNRIQRFLQVHDASVEKLEAQNLKISAEVDDLKNKAADLENKITTDLQLRLKEIEAKIVRLEKQIKSDGQDIQQYQSERKQFHTKKWEIEDVTIPKFKAELALLRIQLQAAQGKLCDCGYYSNNYYQYEKNRVGDLIMRKQMQIKVLQNQASDLMSKMNWFDGKIKELTDKQAADKKNLSLAKVQKAQLEAQIKDAKFSQKDLVNSLEQLQKAIKLKQSQIEKNNWEIKLGENSAKALRASLEELRMTADKSYYTCQDYDLVEVDVQADTNFRVMLSPLVYGSYIENCFGGGYGLIYSGSSLTVPVVRNNFFSNQWISNYGAPYGNYQYRYGSNLINDNFSCVNDGNSLKGKITRVQGRTIYAESNNNSYELQLGDCSAVDISTGQTIPMPNDSIIWKGSVFQTGIYRVHSALCY